MGLVPAEIDDGAPVRWSTADDRALEEVIAQARIGEDGTVVRWGQVCIFTHRSERFGLLRGL